MAHTARLRKPHPPAPPVDLTRLQRRMAEPADLPVLAALVEKTLRTYVEQSLGPWDALGAEQSIQASLRQGHWQILSLDGALLGAMAVLRSDTEMRLAELFVQPVYQGRGWGSALVQELLQEAKLRGVPLRLRVLRKNPARRLYARLGFAVEQGTPERLEMVARPG